MAVQIRASIIMLSVLVLLVASSLTDCARLDRSRQRSTMETCLARFRAIPRVHGIMQARDSADSSTADTSSMDPQPFKGLEIALTLNGAILATADPNANADDLCYKQNNIENLRKLVDTLKQQNMPPTVDFINGKYLDPDLAAAWLASGNLLGNLTYENGKAVQLGPDDFVEDISKEDQQLGALWRQHPQAVKYFRYPDRKPAKSEASRDVIEQYLDNARYITVPYTIESVDDSLADIYCRALDNSDRSCANLVKAYLYSVLMDTTMRARAAARDLAGRDPRHILVLYVNQLTCDTLGQTLEWYRRLGARFISLDEALADPFFKMTTSEGNPTGITVIDRVRDEQKALAQ